MEHKLLKALKDSGFPQYPENLEGYYDNGCYCPSFEELIEECVGDRPNSFYLTYNDEWSTYGEEQLEKWEARYYPNSQVGFIEARGKTPKEAMIRLYIALNKE